MTPGWGIAAGLAAVALPYALHAHGHFPWEAIPGFWALFGGLGAALIVVGSKWLGRAGIQKPEGWYDR